MTEIERKINNVMKTIKEKHFQITSLKKIIKSQDTVEPSQTIVVKNNGKGKTVVHERIENVNRVSATKISAIRRKL